MSMLGTGFGIPIDKFPTRFNPFNNITPFTYQDGLTYIQVLEDMRKFIRESLAQNVNDSVGKLVDDMNAQVDVLIAYGQEFNNQIIAQDSDFTELIRRFSDSASMLLADMDILAQSVVGAEAVVRPLKEAAERARDDAIDAANAAVNATVNKPDRDEMRAADDALRTAIGRVAGASGDRIEYSPNAAAVTGNVGAALSIPTPDNTGQVTHPSVVFIPDQWSGFEYWMAYTPYANSDDSLEDPCLAVSHDGINWSFAPNVNQPLDDAPGSGGTNYNSDTDLVLHPDGTMYLFWRNLQNGNKGSEETLWFRSSTDGVNWTPKRLVMTSGATVRSTLSPAFIWEFNGWTMYAVQTVGGKRLARYRSATALPVGPWVETPGVTLTGLIPGKEPWHVKVIKNNGKYVGLLNDTNTGSNGFNGDLVFITSNDGVKFTGGGAPAIPKTQAGQHDALYRATLIPSARSGYLGFRVWYSAKLGSVWNIFRTWIGEIAPSSARAEASGSRAMGQDVQPSTGFTVNITFPAGRFASAPTVNLNSESSRIYPTASSITKDGFVLRYDNISPGTALASIVVNWYAVQV